MSLPPLPKLPGLPPLGALAPFNTVGLTTGRISTLPVLSSAALLPLSLQLTGEVAPPLYDCPPARILTADPPWQFGDNTPHKGATDHYKTMSVDEICDFPLPPLADNGVLFLWRVAGGNEKDGSLGEDAYRVARAWGFTPKSEMVWAKTLKCKECDGRGHNSPKGLPEAVADAFTEMRVWCDACKGRGYRVATGMGRYVRGAHEVCLIATRGKPQFPDDKSIQSIFNAHRGEHSEKPQRFYEKVEKLYREGPYVELFARRRREGWYQFGDQLPPVGAP